MTSQSTAAIKTLMSWKHYPSVIDGYFDHRGRGHGALIINQFVGYCSDEISYFPLPFLSCFTSEFLWSIGGQVLVFC